MMNYKILGNTGVYVSELCLGTMTFGGEGRWEAIGKQTQQEADDLVKTAVEAGINFIDTANVYSSGLSEKILGQSIKNLGLDRSTLVLATKAYMRMGEGVNQVGLSKLHLHQSVEDSLKRLGTDHIDLLQIHGDDPITPLEETLRALDDLVRSGKVRYIGCCNLAAWRVMKALGIQQLKNYDPFVSCQHYYSLATRDLERELVPLIKDQNLGLLPWSPLAGGFLTGKFRKDETGPADARRTSFDFPPINQNKAFEIVEVLDSLSKENGYSIAANALAWLLHQDPVTSVIIGAKTKKQLQDNLTATEIKLASQHLQALDQVSQLEKEYPGWMVEYQATGRVSQVEE